MRVFFLSILLILCLCVSAQTTTTYEYDNLNRLVKVTTPVSVTTYTYDDLGNRTVKKTKVDGTAVLPISAGSEFRIYPNPAHEWTTVVCPKDAVGQPLCLLYIDGKLVSELLIESTSTTIPLDGLSPGIYVVVIGKSNRPTYTYKLIKQ